MGYFLNDNRIAYGRKGLFEADTVSCRHCQAAIIVKHRQPTGLWCFNCGGPVCDTLKCGTVCLPWKKKIDELLNAIERDKSGQDFARQLDRGAK